MNYFLPALTLLFMGCFMPIGRMQITEVEGRVFDASSGKSLPYVNVSFTATGEGTSTNENGAYSLKTARRPGMLIVSFLGYASQSVNITRGIAQQWNIALEPRQIELIEAEVRPDPDAVNPAKPFMERVLDAKNLNDPAQLPASKQKAYTRIELDVNDISPSQTENWLWGPFSWIFNYVDSSEVRTALPLMIGESIGTVRSARNPSRKQTVIEAAQMSGRITGGDNPSEMNARFPEINLYQNRLLVLNRAFTSPLHDRGTAHYRYYILDTLNMRGRPSIHLAFVPRRKGELTFEGEMWIDTLSLALTRVEGQLSQSANVNYVRSLSWEQDFHPVKKDTDTTVAWMMEHESMLIDMSISDRAIGAYLRRSIDFSESAWSDAWPDTVWTGGRDMVFAVNSQGLNEAQWSQLRTEPLLSREQRVYEMVDSIQNMPAYRWVRKLGYLGATGYVTTGPVEWGAWWSAFTQNPTEGNRFRLDLRTSNDFSTRFMPGIFAAYGTLDQRWKAGLNTRFILRKSPRTEAYFEIKRDVEQFGMNGLLDQGEVFTSLLRTDSVVPLSEVVRAEVSILHSFGKGFSGFLEWRHRRVATVGDWDFKDPTDGSSLDQLITTELTGVLRYAFQERFVSGEFERISLGTEWPILTGTMTWGMPGVLGSQYQYIRSTLDAEDVVRIGLMGRIEWLAQGGTYWGSAPYPLMEVVSSSGTYFMTPESFNLLKPLEFVTDRWVKASVEWHFEGFVLNHIPLLRRIGLREVIGVKSILGTWDSKHEDLVAIRPETTGMNAAYTECSVGLENILRFLRVDAVWRTDLELGSENSWGIRIGFAAEI
tara:strand:+ start:15425 stop:17893 length:2469 start_codon:yes stop_codon:yes gene_type:complete